MKKHELRSKQSLLKIEQKVFTMKCIQQIKLLDLPIF